MAAESDRDTRIQPVILSGGTGTRLWPLSRALLPKQLMALESELSMLQETARRVGEGDRFAPPIVVCNDEHRFIVAQQLRELGIRVRLIVLEPEGRNTAPAAALAALMMVPREPDRLLLVLPSDHVVGDVEGFLAALAKAAPAAAAGALVTFGVVPERPETGYGYIQPGAPLAGAPGCHRVARFIEKPDSATARRLLAAGECYWNAGMFLFTAAAYLAELERFQPDMVAACRGAVGRGREDLDFTRPEAEAFLACAAQSIDYAVMEPTELAVVVAADMGWHDVGAWSTLWEIGDKDGAGNVMLGDVVVVDVRNSYLRSDERLLAVIGLEDVIIVVNDDAVLVVAKDRAQSVGTLVEALKAAGRAETTTHTTVWRPWGHYRTIRVGEGFQVKQITVKPGAKISLQMHRHRAEHWVVVRGTAHITRGRETLVLGENQSTYIPPGVRHRIENPGTAPLELIEVQSGDYLGEDDIVRFEDSYGRT